MLNEHTTLENSAAADTPNCQTTATDDNAKSSCAEKIYRNSGNSKACLALLCVGLKHDDGLPVMDLSASPWIDVKPKSDIKPKLKDLQNEVVRRAELFGVKPIPRPNSWNSEKIMSWLMDHPLNDPDNIAFLTSEVRRVSDIVAAAQKEALEEESKLQQYSMWRDKVPYLRMIHCILEDDIKVAYLKRNDVISRTQLDARNSVDKREVSVYERIADKWNSPDFNPKTEILDCHEDFMVSIDCSYTLVKDLAPATPQKVKDKLTEMRTNLIRIIDNWERSGQGDGGHLDEEENTGDPNHEYGELKNRSQRALDSRSSFLLNRPSYLLYLWELFDKHHLLKTTVNRLGDNVGVLDGDLGSVPLVPIGSNKKKRKLSGTPKGSGTSSISNSDSDSHEFVLGNPSFAASIKNLQTSIEKDRLEDRINFLEDEIRRYKIMQMEASATNKPEMVAFFSTELSKLEADVMKKMNDLEELNGRN
jgi:hypothetical protein